MEPLFYYDLSKDFYSKPVGRVLLILGILMTAFFTHKLYEIIISKNSSFLAYFADILQLMNGVLFILLGTGKFYKKDKYFLKITPDTISYRLPSAKPRVFSIDQIVMIYITSSYIFFKLKNGAQDTIEFSALSYKAVAQFKAALQEVGWQEGVLQSA